MNWFQKVWASFLKCLVEKDRYLLYLEGIGNTLLISLAALAIGVAVGVLIALIKYMEKKNRAFKIPAKICDIYVAIVRGTPVLLQLLIMYFGILAFIPNSKLLVAMITFGLNSAAYVSEIARGGLEAIDEGQLEAGKSLGLTTGMTMRYIILPQALRRMIPPMGNEFITLIKETSIAGYIGVMDLTNVADIIKTPTAEVLMPLLISAAIYLILVILLTFLLKKLERRLSKSDRTS